MPRVLSVSEVRNQLYWAAGGPKSAGEGEPTVALLGSLFHQVFGQLTGRDPHLNLIAPLQLADATLQSWQKALITHAYVTLVAPALSTHQAKLQVRSEEVIAFWTAVVSLCDWIACVLHEQRVDDEPLELARARIFKSAEQEVSAELSDPSWSDTVLLQGRADSIMTQRGTARRCVVEAQAGKNRAGGGSLASVPLPPLACRGRPARHLASRADGVPARAARALLRSEPAPGGASQAEGARVAAAGGEIATAATPPPQAPPTRAPVQSSGGGNNRGATCGDRKEARERVRGTMVRLSSSKARRLRGRHSSASSPSRAGALRSIRSPGSARACGCAWKPPSLRMSHWSTVASRSMSSSRSARASSS